MFIRKAKFWVAALLFLLGCYLARIGLYLAWSAGVPGVANAGARVMRSRVYLVVAAFCGVGVLFVLFLKKKRS